MQEVFCHVVPSAFEEIYGKIVAPVVAASDTANVIVRMAEDIFTEDGTGIDSAAKRGISHILSKMEDKIGDYEDKLGESEVE